MITIYVALLDEGTDVWRPVAAESAGPDIYRIAREQRYDPSVETWEFEPGETVRCERRTFSDGVQAIVAVERIRAVENGAATKPRG